MAALKEINGVPVDYIMELPTRQVNAQGQVYMSKYDEKSTTIFFLNADGSLNGKYYVLPASPNQNHVSEKEETVVSPPIRFHLKAFLIGLGAVLFIGLIYVGYTVAVFEGVI